MHTASAAYRRACRPSRDPSSSFKNHIDTLSRLMTLIRPVCERLVMTICAYDIFWFIIIIIRSFVGFGCFFFTSFGMLMLFNNRYDNPIKQVNSHVRHAAEANSNKNGVQTKHRFPFLGRFLSRRRGHSLSHRPPATGHRPPPGRGLVPGLKGRLICMASHASSVCLHAGNKTGVFVLKKVKGG